MRDRIQLALAGRSWKWLAGAAGIQYSTLATQRGRPKFSISTLVAVAEALGRDVRYFLPQDLPSGGASPSEDALEQIRRILDSVEE